MLKSIGKHPNIIGYHDHRKMNKWWILCLSVESTLTTNDVQPGTLVMAVKETVTGSSVFDIVAEVEKQYVAITPPDSPGPPLTMVSLSY